MEGITVLWVSGIEGRVVPYDYRMHHEMARDFLFWQTGPEGKPLLVVGDAVYGFITIGHKGLLKTAKRLGAEVPDGNPDGAGRLGFTSFRIDSWSSTGFKVDTPADLRPIIENALGMK